MSAQQKSDLEENVTALKGVGPQLALKLQRLHIFTVQDCLFHFPLRYQDRTHLVLLGKLRLYQEALIEGTIVSAQIVFGKRRSLVCKIQDSSGFLTLRFFYFSAAQKNQMHPGKNIRCFGEARRGASGLEMYHPEYKIFDDRERNSISLETNLTPVYPVTEGITQASMRKIINSALLILENSNVSNIIPTDLVKDIPGQNESNHVSLKEILLFLHRPDTLQQSNLLLQNQHPYQQRLALEELVAHQLNLFLARKKIKRRSAYSFSRNDNIENRLLKELPFDLTAAQQKVSEEIYFDLQSGHPMMRLVQGDVGSGKTLIAALAALQVIANGQQAALMAPTEILAEQHFNNFLRWFSSLDISIAFLSGSQKASDKKKQNELIASGAAKMVIGTHALFQEGVVYRDLALIVIDEQHRFGVQQRLALAEKGKNEKYYPHQLIMTATPIPRTLAMTAYADLDCSIIDELPPGRKPVNTVLIDQQRREQVIERVKAVCNEGRQIYWVCTLIEESEELQCEAAENTAETLAKQLPKLKIALVHGRQKAQQKAEVMAAFKQGEIDLLVATTVIEVGVDVPNANLMIIENPERLGLSQLHQLRGRIGRGSEESHCVLLYGSPLSNIGRERLAVMRQTNDGFVIAEKDLQLRGPGEFLGTRQTGDIQFHLADISRDAHLLPAVKQIAEQIIDSHTDLIDPLVTRWQSNRDQYAQA